MNRRSLLLGLGATLAAPAVVRAEVLMPVRKLIAPEPSFLGGFGPAPPKREGWIIAAGQEWPFPLIADEQMASRLARARAIMALSEMHPIIDVQYVHRRIAELEREIYA